MNLKQYFQELKRRHVVKSGIAYLVVAWLTTQVLSIIIPAFELSPSLLKTSIIILTIGFPIWLIFSWIYDLTPEGLKKTEDIEFDAEASANKNVKLNRIIIGALSIAVILLVYNQFRLTDSFETEMAAATKVDSRNSIAILPFINMSSDDDNAFFTEGMHEDVLNKLAGIKELKVIARTSVLPYRNYEGSLDSLGNKLGVKYILEGSVRRFENQIKISTNLIEAATGTSLWSNSYDRTIDNVFKLQSEIAQEITQTLKTTLSPKENNNLNAVPTTVIDAYDNFVKARNILNGYYNVEDLNKAMDYLKTAVGFDSNFIEGWGLLANAYSELYEFALDFDDKSVSVKAKINADEAIAKLEAIDADNVYTLRAKGYYQNMVLEDPIAALQSFDKALEAFPNDSSTLMYQAVIYMYLSQSDKALDNMERAYAIDNQNGMVRLYLKMGYTYSRKYEKLIPLIKAYYKEDPEKTHYEVEMNYYQFLIDGKISSFEALENSIANLQITDRCNLRVVKDNKMVVAMFNQDFNSYIDNWLGAWDSHHKDHGNWSCPQIINDELNQANLMLKNDRAEEASQILAQAIEAVERPINEMSMCVYNKAVYDPKLDYLSGNKELAKEKFYKDLPRVMNLTRYPRGSVERSVLLETADMVATEDVYNIYKQVISKPSSIVGLETVCANPWIYPNLLKDENFMAEVKQDGRFVDFLKINNFL